VTYLAHKLHHFHEPSLWAVVAEEEGQVLDVWVVLSINSWVRQQVTVAIQDKQVPTRNADGVQRCHGSCIDHSNVVGFCLTAHRQVGLQERGAIVKCDAGEGLENGVAYGRKHNEDGQEHAAETVGLDPGRYSRASHFLMPAFVHRSSKKVRR